MEVSLILEKSFLLLIIGTLVSYLGGVFFRFKERIISGIIATIALLVSTLYFFHVLKYVMCETQTVFLFGFLVLHVDLLGWIIAQTGLILALIVSFYSLKYMDEDTGTSKFFPLLLLLVLAILGLSFSFDLFNIYLFFELLSITSFTLVAFRKDRWEPIEAGIKFLVMSVTGSALILLGIALIYKDIGCLNLTSIFNITSQQINRNLWIPISCFTIGFGIKAAIFPLHTWLPDAHAEAPSGISAMLSGIIIEIGFFALIRIYFALGNFFDWANMLIWFALITMTAGNIMALTQKQLKRMLAYSSIAQVGYILLGIGIGFAYKVSSGTTGGFFHIVTHAFMKGLAFLCAGALIYRLGSGKIEDMRGAGWSMPITGITFTVAVLSLAGVPPFSGFMSKLLIYKSGIEIKTLFGWVLTSIAIFNSVFSLGYYLPAVGVLFDRESASPDKYKEAPFIISVSLIILALITIYLGVKPDPVRAWVTQAFWLIGM